MTTTSLPRDAGDPGCLLKSERSRIHLQFGYRGCFGGSDNDLDLRVSATGSLDGHRWAGPSTSKVANGVVLTREQGRAHLHSLVSALLREDDPSEAWSSTRAFVRVSYWCEARRTGPFMIETHRPSERDDRSFAGIVGGAPVPGPGPYSRVHGTIAAARAILASAPGKVLDAKEQLESARRRIEGPYEAGIRVRHDPVEQWLDP